MRTNAYHGGDFFKAIGEDFTSLSRAKKVVGADVLDAWFDPSPRVVKAIKKHLSFALRTSPPTHCEGLIQSIAKHRGLQESQIIVAGGSSDLMFIALPHFVKSGDHVLILDPTYGEYAHIFTKVLDVKLHQHELRREESFNVHVARLLADVQKIKPSLVVLVNPNSPTGQPLPKVEMIEFLSAIPTEVKVLVDETYVEYVGREQSLEQEVDHFPNLMIIKSMSKTYALSGARVGYLVASSDVIDRLAVFTPPWSVSLIGQIAAVEALNDEKYYDRMYKKTHELREDMCLSLTQVQSIDVLPSVGNFFLIYLKEKRLSAETITKQLRTKDIYLRDCSSMSPQMKDDYIRIAVKDAKTNQRVIRALKKLL